MFETIAQFYANSWNSLLSSGTIKVFIIVVPIALPLFLIYAFWVLRFRWLTEKYVASRKPGLLEIKLPKEITKSPAAMEIFFTYFEQGGAGNYGEAFLDGKTRPWFSCELVSIGGEVKFFIWMSEDKFKPLLQTQLYAQYPNLEIFDVPIDKDYTRNFTFDTAKYAMFGAQYKLSGKDPYPIKTYIDYGLDRDQKDEYKIDPMNSVIEYLGSLKKGENAWVQILVRKHDDKEHWKHGQFHEGRNLPDEIKAVIKEVKEKTVQEVDLKDGKTKFANPTKAQTDIIAAIERNASKKLFDCMIRSIYIAEKPSFNAANIGGMVGFWRQYGSTSLNGFRPGFTTDISDTRKDLTRIFPFLKKGGDKEVTGYKKDIFHAFKLRSFFEWPYKNYKLKPFILSTEELATIFHFPSGMVTPTPTLERIGSKKSEAPANLPI